MLHLIDQSLEAFLRAEVPLPADQIDVSFDPPDRDWSARTTKPTVNVYLWDVRTSLKERNAGIETYRDEAGHVCRSAPRPRVELRYLVTAWTTDTRDEHQLLGAVLSALFMHPELPAQYLQGEYASVRPIPTIAAAYPNGEENADFWSALGGRLKPGLNLVLTATLDAALAHEVGPPVTRYEVEVEDRLTGEASTSRALTGDIGTRATRHLKDEASAPTPKATKKKR